MYRVYNADGVVVAEGESYDLIRGFKMALSLGGRRFTDFHYVKVVDHVHEIRLMDSGVSDARFLNGRGSFH